MEGEIEGSNWSTYLALYMSSCLEAKEADLCAICSLDELCRRDGVADNRRPFVTGEVKSPESSKSSESYELSELNLCNKFGEHGTKRVLNEKEGVSQGV